MSVVCFRADASNEIGVGHVMRCLALADALRARGALCSFVHRRQSGHLADAIRARGHALLELPPTTGTGVEPERGLDQLDDARETGAAFAGRPDWLFVDHYQLDERWEAALGPHVGGIAVIDDLGDRKHECALLLNQNYLHRAPEEYARLVPPGARVLLGPRYALLRPQYAAARRTLGPRRGPAARLFVFYGGSDATDETGRALRVLGRPEFRALRVDIVVGVNHPRQAELRRAAAARPGTILHAPREDLVGLMAEADLALGGGGTTMWERCALGLPSIVTAVADNQLPSCTALADDGVIDYLGPWNLVTDDDLERALTDLLRSPERLADHAERSSRVTDGHGCLRVAEAVIPSAAEDLSMRPAESADRQLYFEWANDPTTRATAHHPEPIPWDTHRRWFDQRLADSHASLWVMQTADGLPVGQARIEKGQGSAVISYSVDADFRGRGWGSRLLLLARRSWHERGESAPLKGEVRRGNEASRRAFLRAGFEEESIRADGVSTFADGANGRP